MSQQSYPIHWPAGWPRTGFRRLSNFGDRSIDSAVNEVFRQLKLLGVGDWNVVISSNLLLRKDGLPISGQRQPDDPSVAVYFKLKDRPCVLACDRWVHVEDNIWAIAKDIEAQRGRIRWGVGSVEQAFAGYVALTDGKKTWREVFGYMPGDKPTATDFSQRYRDLALKRHPDHGGSTAAMAELNGARDQAHAEGIIS